MAADLTKTEAHGWLPHISQKVVRRAAEPLPAEQSDILEAWEAELEDYSDRPVTMLIVALRIAHHRKLIAGELLRPIPLEVVAIQSRAGKKRPVRTTIVWIDAYDPQSRKVIRQEAPYRRSRILINSAVELWDHVLVALEKSSDVGDEMGVVSFFPSNEFSIEGEPGVLEPPGGADNRGRQVPVDEDRAAAPALHQPR